MKRYFVAGGSPEAFVQNTFLTNIQPWQYYSKEGSRQDMYTKDKSIEQKNQKA